jgi:hypothetical protein
MEREGKEVRHKRLVLGWAWLFLPLKQTLKSFFAFFFSFKTKTASPAAGATQRPDQFAQEYQPVRSAYQPPASSTFLSERTSPATSRNQPAVLFSQNKPAPAISHQPTEQAV